MIHVGRTALTGTLAQPAAAASADPRSARSQPSWRAALPTDTPARVFAVSPSITTSLLDPFVLLERCPSYEATPTSNPSPCGKPVDNSRL